jgi:hypothetical protein
MIRTDRTDSFPFRRPAWIAPRTLNFLIFGCAALTLAVYLIALASSSAGISDRLGTGIWLMISLAVFFGVLDSLVILRLARPLVAKVTTRLAPGSPGKVVLAIGSVVALSLTVVIFFLATCYAMMQGF